jgi:hypothetical protein
VSNVLSVDGMRNSYRSLFGEPERNRQLRELSRRWENNIKMDLKEVGFEGVDCIHVFQELGNFLHYNKNQRLALVNTEMNIRIT